MLQNILIKLLGTLDTLKNCALPRDGRGARIPKNKNVLVSESRDLNEFLNDLPSLPLLSLWQTSE